MDNKPKLQSVINYPLMDIKAALTEAGFSYEKSDASYTNIKCCDELCTCSGFFGTESIECEKCGTIIQDVFGVLQVGNSTATMLNPDDYDIDDFRKHWIVLKRNNLEHQKFSDKFVEKYKDKAKEDVIDWE